MSGANIAAEISAALVEAGEATGDDKYTCTLRKATGVGETPETAGDATYTYHPLGCVQGGDQKKYGPDEQVRMMKNTLMMDATGQAPKMNDTVALGVDASSVDDVPDGTRWHRIMHVDTLAPGGTPLLYELVLED